MVTEMLSAPLAAERLGLTTFEVNKLIYERRIRWVMVDGNPLIPDDAIDEYRSQLAS